MMGERAVVRKVVEECSRPMIKKGARFLFIHICGKWPGKEITTDKLFKIVRAFSQASGRPRKDCEELVWNLIENKWLTSDGANNYYIHRDWVK